MDKIIPGLILAAVSGLGFLAYRHPKSFSRYFPFLIVPLIIVQFVSGIFSIGYSFGQFHPYDPAKNAPPIPSWFPISVGLLAAYLLLLYYLPRLLRHDKPNKKEKPKDEA